MRLQKYMAKCGVASRRKSEKIITNKRVKVNGRIINKLGYKVDIDRDIVEVDDRKISLEKKLIYILLNKPEGYITTVDDQFDRNTVLDLISGIKQRIYPVGRLDYDTSGLLLLTNDGDLTYKLTHPKHEIKKVYVAKIKGIPNETELNKFRNGLKIDNYVTSKANISIKKVVNKNSIVQIEIHEGKNRQVRKMCDKINHQVLTLKRIAMGKIYLNDLNKGNWRFLTNKEVKYLKTI